MAEPYKAPGIIACFTHFWKKDTFFRIIVSVTLIVVMIVVAINAFNAAYVYEDWRCFTADCRILKTNDREMLMLGDDP